MGRDVEFNATASDKTAPGLASVERRFKATQDKIDKASKEAGAGLGKSLDKGVAGVAPRIAAHLTSTLSSVASAGGPLLGGMAVAAAPVIAGTLSAAIIGGAGIGGVIGGVALAARDPRVKAAGAELGKNVMARLDQQAQVFVAPVLDSIDEIGDSFERVSDKTDNIFRNSSRYVAPLTAGLTQATEGIIGGVDDLVARAGPVVDSISRGLGETGDNIGELFSDLSENADGAAASVDTLFATINGAVDIIGPAITGLTAVNEQLDRFGQSGGLLNAFSRLNDQLDTTGTFSRHVAGETTSLAGAAGEATDQANAYFSSLASVNAELERQAAASRDVFSATTNAAGAAAAATEVIGENGRTMALNTEAGRANRTALSNLAAAYVRQYEAAVAVNGVGPKTTAIAQGNRDAFIALATKATGSARAARNLADSLGLIPAKKPTTITANTTSASGRVAAFRKQLDSVPNVIPVTIRVGVSESARAAALRKQSAPAFSASPYFAPAASDGYRSRTGGPTQVSASIENTILLDGRPFRAYTDRAVADSEARQRWRRRVGGRYSAGGATPWPS